MNGMTHRAARAARMRAAGAVVTASALALMAASAPPTTGRAGRPAGRSVPAADRDAADPARPALRLVSYPLVLPRAATPDPSPAAGDTPLPSPGTPSPAPDTSPPAPAVPATPASGTAAPAAPSATSPATTPSTPPATAAPAVPVAVTPSSSAGPGVHGPFSMTADMCAVCHRGHTASSANLLSHRAGQSTLCFTCHDGTGAVDVKTRFTTASIPANDPAARIQYGHDLSNAAEHTLGNSNEFGGVSNRHTECADCHNPHRPGGAGSTSTVDGWTASGTLAGVSGVSVANGPAGTAPTYTFLDGLSRPVTLEYQLCLKCHSGFTILPSNDGRAPSDYLLDKGVEFNPANPSYHPVESAGRNQTAAMAVSLAGTSPYKLWTFTPASTIRCGNCHGDDTVATAGGQSASGGVVPAHRSANRGMLLRNYRDRVLKRAGEPYAAADFALCYLCHAESPFVSDSSTATTFTLHAQHVSGIPDEGSGGTDIDTAGAGQGNALCAECHYRIHAVSYGVGNQSVSGSRLVSFAPDVTATDGVLSWTAGSTSGGTCTLTCHGKQHTGARY